MFDGILMFGGVILAIMLLVTVVAGPKLFAEYLVEKSRGRGSAGKAPANRPARESRTKG